MKMSVRVWLDSLDADPPGAFPAASCRSFETTAAGQVSSCRTINRLCLNAASTKD